MKPQLALAIILSLTCAPLWADEGKARWVSTDLDGAMEPPAPEDAGAENSAFINWQEEDVASPQKAAREFRRVCDCDCAIPSLVDWCDCETPSHTTECWTPHGCDCAEGNCYLSDDGSWYCNDKHCDVSGERLNPATGAVRFGWWGTSNDGSPTKTGEYQDLTASPFWDVDFITSDGRNSWDVVLSGLDNEANDARVLYYGQHVGANVHFQRYLRRLDHDPLAGFDLSSGTPTVQDNIVTQDLNVGEDYAIRVEQLDARFKGDITKNIKWRLNVWGQRKFGERQANAVAHCFNINAPNPGTNTKCHVLSQSQRIDWVTTELQPVVEARWEYVTAEYSRTMRSFGQDDGFVDRNYTRFGFSPANNVLGPAYDYGLTPENFTQIDRLKLSSTLSEGNDVYANLYIGDTHNEFRDTHRRFSGVDVRLINTVLDNFTWTLYANMDREDNELPETFLSGPPLSSPNNYDQISLRHPVDYLRSRTGIKANWQPYGRPASGGAAYGLQDGLSFAGGYEYFSLNRDYATYTRGTSFSFTQPDTKGHRIEFGPSVKWSRALNSYVRYRGQFAEDPIYGVSPGERTFNSNQPEQDHIIDVGGTWQPVDNFLATAKFSFINRWHDSQYANFSEDNYPFMLTTWYAPTDRLSLTGGYGYFNNWIDQDITIGWRSNPLETTNWSYGGENHIVTLNANYVLTQTVQVMCGYEYNRGDNAFAAPASTTGADWSLLPSYSDVVVETQRWTAGVDWHPYRRTNVFARYVYFDYNDIASSIDSGTSHMALGGASVDF